jgi:hypothetical protein
MAGVAAAAVLEATGELLLADCPDAEPLPLLDADLLVLLAAGVGTCRFCLVSRY